METKLNVSVPVKSPKDFEETLKFFIGKAQIRKVKDEKSSRFNEEYFHITLDEGVAGSFNDKCAFQLWKQPENWNTTDYSVSLHVPVSMVDEETAKAHKAQLAARKS